MQARYRHRWVGERQSWLQLCSLEAGACAASAVAATASTSIPPATVPSERRVPTRDAGIGEDVKDRVIDGIRCIVKDSRVCVVGDDAASRWHVISQYAGGIARFLGRGELEDSEVVYAADGSSVEPDAGVTAVSQLV